MRLMIGKKKMTVYVCVCRTSKIALELLAREQESTSYRSPQSCTATAKREIDTFTLRSLTTANKGNYLAHT